MSKQGNKAFKCQRGAGIDIWESRYVVDGREMRRDAKRQHKRAQRRLNKEIIRESSDC